MVCLHLPSFCPSVGHLPPLTLFPPLSLTEAEVGCCVLLYAQLGSFQPHSDREGKPDESV